MNRELTKTNTSVTGASQHYLLHILFHIINVLIPKCNRITTPVLSKDRSYYPSSCYTTAIMEHHLYSLLSTNLSLLSSYVQTENQICQVLCMRNFLFLRYFQMLIIVQHTSSCLKSQLYQCCQNFINSTYSSKNIFNNVSCLTNSVT